MTDLKVKCDKNEKEIRALLTSDAAVKAHLAKIQKENELVKKQAKDSEAKYSKLKS